MVSGNVLVTEEQCGKGQMGGSGWKQPSNADRKMSNEDEETTSFTARAIL